MLTLLDVASETNVILSYKNSGNKKAAEGLAKTEINRLGLTIANRVNKGLMDLEDGDYLVSFPLKKDYGTGVTQALDMVALNRAKYFQTVSEARTKQATRY